MNDHRVIPQCLFNHFKNLFILTLPKKLFQTNKAKYSSYFSLSFIILISQFVFVQGFGCAGGKIASRWSTGRRAFRVISPTLQLAIATKTTVYFFHLIIIALSSFLRLLLQTISGGNDWRKKLNPTPHLLACALKLFIIYLSINGFFFIVQRRERLAEISRSQSYFFNPFFIDHQSLLWFCACALIMMIGVEFGSTLECY